MSRNSDKLFVFSSKSLSVITDCVHYKNGSKIGSANHTLIRQLNSLFSYFEKIYICCPLKNTSDGHILSYYDKKNIKFYFTPNVGGRSFQSKVSLILSIPFLLKQIFNATVNSDFVYQRFPNNINVPGFFLMKLLKKNTFATYTGIWDTNEGSLSYIIQKYLLIYFLRVLCMFIQIKKK